jgi:hypothetical protein
MWAERPFGAREAIALPTISTSAHRQGEPFWGAGSTRVCWPCPRRERSDDGAPRRKRAMKGALESCGAGGGARARAVRILAIPCGIPRDLLELVRMLRGRDSLWLDRLEYHGMDIDSEVLVEASAVISECGLASVQLHRGEALSADDYPPGPFDLVVSTGLGEFLQRDELATFYRQVHGLLRRAASFLPARRPETLRRRGSCRCRTRDAVPAAPTTCCTCSRTCPGKSCA